MTGARAIVSAVSAETSCGLRPTTAAISRFAAAIASGADVSSSATYAVDRRVQVGLGHDRVHETDLARARSP